jgi:hypothetical protein
VLRWHGRENIYIRERWEWDLSDFMDEVPSVESQVAAKMDPKVEPAGRFLDFQDMIDSMEDEEDEDEIELKDQYKAA